MSGFPLQPPVDATLTAPLKLPATSTGHLTTQGGSTLDDGSGDATIAGTLVVTGDTTVSTIKSSGSTISAVTVPASGTALPAVTVDTLIYIVGGVITAITLNGDALPTSIPLIYQRPGDSIVIDYTTAPTAIYAQNL